MSVTGAADRGQIGATADEVRRRLLGMIERGILQPGQKVAAERELAVTMGVSRSTLRQALGALEESGVVRRVPGRGGGTYISAPKVERDLSRIVGVPMLLRDQGFTAGSRVVSLYELLDTEYGLRPEEAIEHIEVVAASIDEAAILATEPGAPLISITRTTRDAGGIAFEYSHDLFRADRTRITVKVKGSPSSEKARLRGRVVELVP